MQVDAEGSPADASVRTLTVARELATSGDEELAAVWFGPGESIVDGGLIGAGVKDVYRIHSGALSGYVPQAWARALAGLAAGLPDGGGRVSAFVAAATDHGNEVLAHLGAITGLPMAANCISATRTSPSECSLVRQRWAGSLLEDAVLEAPLALLTVASDAIPAAPAASAESGAPADSAELAGAGAVGGVAGAVGGWSGRHDYEPELVDGDLVVQAAESAERRSGVSLASARVVVGGGRGVGGPEGFAVLEELAGMLGAAVGVSRVVTSEGWRPHRQQVGQTGTKITPELYLACGISGAIQHMAGCQGAKTIVAINTDAGAPIVAKADYAVIGDLHEVLPALITALKARQT